MPLVRLKFALEETCNRPTTNEMPNFAPGFLKFAFEVPTFELGHRNSPPSRCQISCYMRRRTRSLSRSLRSRPVETAFGPPRLTFEASKCALAHRKSLSIKCLKLASVPPKCAFEPPNGSFGRRKSYSELNLKLALEAPKFTIGIARQKFALKLPEVALVAA